MIGVAILLILTIINICQTRFISRTIKNANFGPIFGEA